MSSNEDLQKQVMEAIKWEPLLHAAEIGVTVDNGIVTLTGIVDSYARKLEAEEAVKNVAGVSALVEKIEIKFAGSLTVEDSTIAADIISNLKSNWEIPHDQIMVKVENGWATLDGEIQWNYQKDSTRASILRVNGVKGVINNIKIKSNIIDEVEKIDIERAMKRNWSIAQQAINIGVTGNKVTLIGTVHSWYEHDEAERIAWNAPGVGIVDNELQIAYGK